MTGLWLWTVAALAFVASLAGGLFGIKGLSSKTQLIQFANGFSGGFLISISLVHLLPEATLKENYIYALFGFGLFYIIEAITKGSACADEMCPEEHREKGYLAFAGLSFHSLIDGIAMGFGFGASETLGILIGIAILLHKAPMGFSLVSILLGRGQTPTATKTMLFIFSLLTPVGAIFGAFSLIGRPELLPMALAFSGGTFLHISISELLPKVHTESSRNIVYYVLSGIALGLLTKLIGG